MAARSAAVLGAKVALIERDLLGGNLFKYGMYPFKSDSQDIPALCGHAQRGAIWGASSAGSSQSILPR